MTHNPRDVETVARLLCATYEVSEDLWPSHIYTRPAALLLDALQAKGWKITTPHEFPVVSRESGKAYKPLSWSIMHDAAPICPREDR